MVTLLLVTSLALLVPIRSSQPEAEHRGDTTKDYGQRIQEGRGPLKEILG